MKSFVGSLRKLIFGETWTIPLGVGAALGLALLVRDALPQSTWHAAGGFCLTALIVATLAFALRQAPNERS
jgi:hypothetical protein